MEQNSKVNKPIEKPAVKKDPLLEQMDTVKIEEIFATTNVSTDLPIPRRDCDEKSLFNRHDGIAESHRKALDVFKYLFTKLARRVFAYEQGGEITIKIKIDKDKDENVRDNIMSIITTADITITKLPKATAKNSGYLTQRGKVSLEDPRVNDLGLFPTND